MAVLAKADEMRWLGWEEETGPAVRKGLSSSGGGGKRNWRQQW